MVVKSNFLLRFIGLLVISNGPCEFFQSSECAFGYLSERRRGEFLCTVGDVADFNLNGEILHYLIGHLSSCSVVDGVVWWIKVTVRAIAWALYFKNPIKEHLRC